ncbi:MAG TPA: hypothetical protein VL383_11280 [Gemmatimonadaceae bacterium]|jgi:hypothetical protein|nr:hypothetical protein [Gemmatimonadaceae bacterium]
MLPRRAVLITALVVASVPAGAQSGGQPPGSGVSLIQLANEVAALEARVSKLESGAIVAADLVGQWRVYSLGVETGATPPGGAPLPAYIGTETVAPTTVTLRADGTGTWQDGGNRRFDLLQGAPWHLQTTPPSPASADFTWSLVNGNLRISLFYDEDGTAGDVAIAAGGRVLVWGAGKSNDGGASSWSQLGIAIRIP